MKISVIGDGAWGTALALNMLHNNHEVSLWGAFPEYIDQMAAKRENFKFLPGITLPGDLKLKKSIENMMPILP